MVSRVGVHEKRMAHLSGKNVLPVTVQREGSFFETRRAGATVIWGMGERVCLIPNRTVLKEPLVLNQQYFFCFPLCLVPKMVESDDDQGRSE